MTKRKPIAELQKRGRKQEYPDSTFAAILARYAAGENLMAILVEKGMPEWSTFWNRVMGPSAVPELATAHARARESWADCQVEQAVQISDTPQMGKKVRKGPKGKIEAVTHGDAVDARRLRVSTRLWFAERILARQYGTQRVAHQNPDGTPIAPTNVIPVINLTVVQEKS
jgi:hypothetical protein